MVADQNGHCKNHFTHDYTNALGNHFCTGNSDNIEQHGEPIEANKLAQYFVPVLRGLVLQLLFLSNQPSMYHIIAIVTSRQHKDKPTFDHNAHLSTKIIEVAYYKNDKI